MGFLNDLKKVLFGAKSTARSAGRKAREEGEEFFDKAREGAKDAAQQAEDWMNTSGKEAVEGASEWLEQTGREIGQKGEELVDDARDWARRQRGGPKDKPVEDELFDRAEQMREEKTPDERPQAPDTGQPEEERDPNILERSGKKVMDTAEDVGERILGTSKKEDPEWVKKAKDTSEKVGERVLEEGGKVWDKVEEAGKGMRERFDQLVEKATEEAEKEKLEEELRKAKAMEEELARKAKSRESAKDDSLLDTHDSFFDKARRFAEGDYRGEGDDMRIEKDDEYTSKKKEGTVKGFEDRDGDGDEIVDDAVLDESEEESLDLDSFKGERDKKDSDQSK